ncbi:MAG: aconitate hydratase AcnA [Chelatococcus sp.]|nr:aconitate hydratase AcnA [Chelatococcus sp.]
MRPSQLPFACRVLVENLARGSQLRPDVVSSTDIAHMIHWNDHIGESAPLNVGRVILPDSSGLPVLLDMAALRDAVAREGSDPTVIEPSIPVDVIVDHSLQVDVSAVPGAASRNLHHEFERNSERYRFLKWAQQAFRSVRVFPPGTGIIHQINLEHIAPVVGSTETGLAYPDFVLGGDSHTPMVNAIGVLGWGVGGIEAQAAMLAVPYIFPIPEFVGVRLNGELPSGATTTDLVLHVTERLRREGVVSSIVEYCGAAVAKLPVPARATLSNMAPEYGATAAFFPIDQETISYLTYTRSPAHADFVERYSKANDLFADPGHAEPLYARTIEIELGSVGRSVAGPRRPQDRLDIPDVADDFRRRLPLGVRDGGFACRSPLEAEIRVDGRTATITHGAIAIAAITACTNTSNPEVMVAAGLLAEKAVNAGLLPAPWVKTSLAPGSRVVTRYLEELGLLNKLEAIGFGVVGYGCTTCGGKSGPLHPAMSATIAQTDLVAASVLSGNRNFEGRIHRQVRANYIMSPPLVVAYALAGRVDIDLDREPLGAGSGGNTIYLSDIWPSQSEITQSLEIVRDPALFAGVYGEPNRVALWDDLAAPSGSRFQWEEQSTYLIEPPFIALGREQARSGLPDRIDDARALGVFGDSLTTDHISPSGEIPSESAAGQYLLAKGIPQAKFNTYVGRRCNHEVMARGTFANLRIKNLLVEEREGGWARVFPEGDVWTVYDAAAIYRARSTPLIVLGGRDYGMGSSRDWAAKGTALLGIRAVIAENFERIHRSNLIGMGVIPLQFAAGEGWRQLGLKGSETFAIEGLLQAVDGVARAVVRARQDDHELTFEVSAAVTTQSERDCLKNGGIMVDMFKRFSRHNHEVQVQSHEL